MEELYTLSDGSQVDISGYSQFEKTSFLMKNPGAKKQKGVTKSAGVTSKKPQARNGESTQVDGSSVSQKFRLAGEEDLNIMQKRGILPPPSAQPKMSVDQVKSLYDLEENSIEEKAKWQQATFKQPGARKAFNTKIKLNGSEKEIKEFVKNFSDDPVTGALGENSKYKIAKLKEKIQETDSELQNPYMYYSSENQEQPDDFVEKNYNKKELEGLGINSQDFDGYLNKKGYKEDFLKKESEGLFEGEGDNFFTGYNIGLAKELSKKKMLNMYMEDMQRRDFTKQNLYQDIEIIEGNRDKKDILNNELFDTNGIVKYVEKNFPIITEKLKERDAENAKLYQESKSGGTDFFSWDTVSKIGESGWNAIVDRTSQLSSTAYQMIGMEGTAEGIRAMSEENKFLEPVNRGIAYVSGKSINYQGTKYIVDSKGEIYDADAKIRVTDIFDQKTKEKLVEDSKYGQSDWAFSSQGAAVQTSGVMADMLIQAAVTRGVGEFGVIASETRLALTGARKTSAFTSLLNDSSALLRKIPLKKSTGYSMISQGTLGYSQGYEDTLKAARDNGINDKEAFELAGVAAQRMAILYSTTGVISPQTKVVENIFGSKSIIKKAIEQYTKTGTKGFVSYLDNMIKNTPRNLIEFAEEGGKEVVQENTQQILENKGVNYMTNRDAGKKIMNETFSADDFVNTSILSFVSAGLMAKAKLPSFHTDDKIDDLMSLSTLAKNKKEFTKVIDGLVGQKVFTNEQAKSLKQDVDIYSNNINKILKTTPTDAAMPIMRELDKVSKLTDEKQTVDKAFHPQIDQKIEDIRNNINKIYYESELKVKNEAISKAIKKGVVKDIQMKSFSNTEDLKKYLVEELNMPQDTADLYSGQTGFAITGKTLKQYSKNPELISDNAQVIVVDESKTLDAGVIQHEFLHGLLQNTLKDNPEAQKLIGVALSKELMKIHDTLVSKGSKEKVISGSFMQRIGAYVERSTKQKAESLKELELKKISAEGDSALIAQAEAEHNDYIAGVEGVQWEEMLTLYSDALRSGEITYNENTFTKLGDVLRRVLQYLGIKDIKFESGKDVYNFIKDYNSSVESGNWGKAFKKMGAKGATINTEKLFKETGIGQTTAPKTRTKSDFRTDAKFSLAEDRKSPEAIKKDVNKGYDKEKWSVGSNVKGENPAINKVLYDILQEYDYIIKGKSKALGYANLPDFSQIDMIAETQMELIPHIRNFNKEFFEKREEFKKQLEEKGLDPKSKEFKDKVEEQDLKGYKGKKGIVKENDDLNAWINSQLVNKMGNALRSGNVTTQKFTEDIDNEMFKETKIIDGYGGEEGYLMDEGDNIFDAEQDYDAEQSQLARLLNDPVYNFVDRNGVPINIETIPFGGFFITEASDPTVAANRKLKTETDPIKIQQLKRQLDNLQRGLDLQAKKDITPEEREELKGLKSFKSYDLSTGMMVNTFEALSVEDTPSKIISDEVGREILRSPNIETLEYRNFKEKLSTLSKTMSRRMTFKNGPEIESFMYNNWKLLYDVINHPVDPITGESSYASKKLPPRLKMFDEKGDLNKIKDITRVKFLQSYYGIEEATRIIKTYGNAKTIKELNNFDDVEISEVTGKNLWHTAYFDRRTALMELFGDVMVLQEARRLIREPSFLDKVKDRNVNLYNELKDDVIRAQVLNNMAKGKSDIVKFSLVPDKKIIKKPSYITTSPLNMIGDNPMYSLKYEELFSNPSDLIKFSLTEIDEKAPEPIAKFKNLTTGIVYEDNHGWVIKTLQLSDAQDDGVNVKKLHTFKPGPELKKEVESRFNEMYNSLRDDIDKNQWVIKEYKEGYIDTMLQRSLTIPAEAFHTPYWTKMKESEGFRNEELRKVQIEQAQSLDRLADTLEAFDPEGDKNSFFKYLFLKDVLSNRYYPNGPDNIIKKSIKKSEYKTTIAPIQDYLDSEQLWVIWSQYSNNKSVGIGAIYLSREMKMEAVDFDDNFVQSVSEDNSLYKFNMGDNKEEIDRLNKLSSYSTRSGYPGSSWCTGASRSIAQMQLSSGDFYIIANKNTKVPVLAVRYIGEEIAEMAGTRNNQDLWPQDFDLIEQMIYELPSSNKKEASIQLQKARLLSKVSNEEISMFEDKDILKELIISKDVNIHFEKETYEKSSTAAKRLRKLTREESFKAGVPLIEIYKEGFNIDENGFSNIENEEDLETLSELKEFTESVVIKIGIDDGADIDFLENVAFPSEELKMNELVKAEVVEIAIAGMWSLEAKKLTDAKLLAIAFERLHEEPFLFLPEKINYHVDLTFFDGDPTETYEITVFDKETDMSNKDLGIYFDDQEVDGVILSNVKNTNSINVTGAITDFINLPKKIKRLAMENIQGKSGPYIDVNGVKEIENLDMEFYGFDALLFKSLEKLETLNITHRDEYNSNFEQEIIDSGVFKIAKNVNFTYETTQGGASVTKNLKSENKDIIKFSLAEDKESNMSNYTDSELENFISKVDKELSKIKDIKTFNDYLKFFTRQFTKNNDNPGILGSLKEKTGSLGNLDEIYNAHAIKITVDELKDKLESRPVLVHDVINPMNAEIIGKEGQVVTRDMFTIIEDKFVLDVVVLRDNFRMDSKVSKEELFELYADLGVLIRDAKNRLSEIKENKEFLNKFPNLLNSKEYKSFTSKVKDIYHSGSDIEKNWKKNDIKAIWFSAGASQGWYGDGTLYKTNLASIPGSIVMPDWNRSGDVWNERFAKKFPEVQDALLKDMYDKGENVEYVTDDKGNTLYDDNLKNVTWEEYLEEEFPQIFNLTGKISLDKFIEVGKSRGQDKVFENIVSNYFKKDKNRKPLTKKLTFKEYKDKELEFEQPTPNILWLLKPENIKYADKVILEYIKGYEEDPDSYLEQTEGKRDNPDGTLGDYTELIVIGPMKGQKIEKQDNKGVYSPIKFSLAEEKNGRISTFLNGLPFSEQWVVARDIDTAITKARIASSAEQVEIGKLKDQISKTIDPVKRKELKDRITELKKSDKITFKVPSRSKMTDKSTAYFIISKVAEGYNDFEFTVKKNATGPLTTQVLEALDFKSKNAEKTRELNSNLEESMNKIIEENKGIEASETFSAETAKNIGKNIGKNKIYLPPEDEDFLGLLYTLASGKGKVGEEQLKFFEDNLVKPYSEAMLNLMHARQVMYKDWKDLINNKHKGISKLLKQDSGYGGYLVDQAVRVYLWEVAGYKIPGLDNKDLFNLKQVVRTNPKLRAFAEDVRFLSKQANGYTEPDNNWGFGSIVGDINNIISKSNRVKYLEHWKSNVEKIFSDQNMNKIEAVYGKRYVKALEDILGRMKTGSNRAIGANDAMLNWINGSTAVTMFANMRSAILQTLGAVNYINTSDNNILKAGMALLDVPQYLKDFRTIWFSDYLKDRRSGLMNDVAEAELAQTMNDPRNISVADKFKAANYWILKNGYGPTRVADSFAIAFGGAGFYRNRINTYIKEGMSQDEAKEATMRDFYQVSEVSQQSADVSKISMNQASTKGRLLLSFLNTPFQYSRLIKRSVIDLAKGRGSAANNVAKIVYYGAIQNIFFNFMQNALFSMIWDDDEEQVEGKFDAAKFRTINGAMDTLLRGAGLTGVIMSTAKNVIVKWYERHGDPKAYGDLLLELANVSPSIGIKARALVKSYKAIEYNMDEIEYKGFSIDNNYAIEALTSLTSALTNVPVDRLVTKMNNIQNALDSDLENWQRIWSFLGYSEYNLGINRDENIELNSRAELKIPELSQNDLKTQDLK
jgi:hypothetical protein